MTLFIFLVILGYLMGSICSAIIVCRTFNLPDPRAEGSKNPGATNVLRIAGKQYAAIVMVFDVLKGTIPVLIARALEADPATVAFTVLAAVIGHMYPVFFGFKGGKGVATAIGALLGFHFIIGVMVIATWLLVANFSRYSSLASIVSITLSPFYSLLLVERLDIFPPLFVMVILVLYKHKNNITRLIDGVEPKIKLKQSVIEEIIESAPGTPSDASEQPQQKTLAEENKEIKEIKAIKTTAKKTVKKAEPVKKTTKDTTSSKSTTKKAAKTKVPKTDESAKKAKTTKPKAKKPKTE